MIKIINNDIMKSQICESVLRDLPEWFGREESLKKYIENSKKYPMVALFEEGEAIGFYSLRQENETTLDMYVLGLKKKYHGRGFGKVLQDYVTEWAKEQGYAYLMVLTLSKSHGDKGYAKTREFYHRCGFVDIYETNKIWTEEYPTQIMVKKL